MPEVGQRWLGGKGSPPVAGFIFLWPDNFVACFQECFKILGKDGTHKIRYPHAFRMGGWQAKECIIITLAWSPVHPTKPYHHQLADGSHLIGVLEWRVTLMPVFWRLWVKGLTNPNMCHSQQLIAVWSQKGAYPL